MDTPERVKLGTKIAQGAVAGDLSDYIRAMEKEDPLAAELLDVYMSTIITFNSPRAIKKGRALLPKVAGKPELAIFLFRNLGAAHRWMGEMSTSDDYFLRAEDLCEHTGDTEGVFITRVHILINRFFKAEYEALSRDLKTFLQCVPFPHLKTWARSYVATLEIIRGKPEKAVEGLDSILEEDIEKFFRFAVMELKGIGLRVMGKLSEARGLYLESSRLFVEHNSAYAAFPCAKALELTRLAGLEPPTPGLIRRCLTLAKKGSWGEQAAAEEIGALMMEDDGEVAVSLFAAAENYSRAHQHLEAFVTGLTSAYLAYGSGNPVFFKALKFLAPLAQLYPGFRRDHLLGEFMTQIESLMRTEAEKRDEGGIKAHLLDGLKVFVDGKEIPPFASWRNKKAGKALIYLLLPQNTGCPMITSFTSCGREGDTTKKPSNAFLRL